MAWEAGTEGGVGTAHDPGMGLFFCRLGRVTQSPCTKTAEASTQRKKAGERMIVVFLGDA